MIAVHVTQPLGWESPARRDEEEQRRDGENMYRKSVRERGVVKQRSEQQ